MSDAVLARSAAVEAAAEFSAAETAFDDAITRGEPMSVLRVLDREMDDAARAYRAAADHADHAARMLA